MEQEVHPKKRHLIIVAEKLKRLRRNYYGEVLEILGLCKRLQTLLFKAIKWNYNKGVLCVMEVEMLEY